MSVFCNAALEDEPVVSFAPTVPPGSPTVPQPPSAPDPARAVREFEAICAKHHLHCGAPEDLASFLAALGTNKLLAMNFWSVVARLSEPHEGSALGSSDLLAAIVSSVTGKSLGDTRATDGPLVDRLSRLLAGEDVQLDGTQAPHRDEYRDEPAQMPSAEEVLPLRTSEAPKDDPAFDTPRAPAPDRFYGQRLSLRPDYSSALNRDRAEHSSGASAFGSLASYADQDNRHRTGRRIGAAAVILTLAAGACLFFTRGYSAWQQPGNTARSAIASLGDRSSAMFSRIGGSVRAGFGSARDAWRGQSSSARVTPAVPASASGTGSALPGKSTTGTTPLPPSSAGAQHLHYATQPSHANAQLQPAASSASSAAPDDSLRAPATEHNRVSRERASGRFNPDASLVGDNAPTRGGEIVVVPAALMRDRLISSRVPILPDGVPSRHAFVVLQAVVTSRGNVRDIHGVMGRHELVQAAIDAVSAWRYRPYLLNGTPVDVATTINVSFDGND